MLALIDSDILRYEVGYASQFDDEDSGDPVQRTYEFTTSLLDEKIRIIKEDTEADEVLLFLTNDDVINNIRNKKRKRKGLPQKELIPNFREKIAVTQPYKGSRIPKKPLHFNNLTNYMLEHYNCYVADTGIEADDAMCIIQTLRLEEDDTIICSRDKDLKICQGNHYTWECGRQPSTGPYKTDRIGFIELSKDRKKIIGYGLKFFYSQLITGDVVDNIPGLPGKGCVFAFNVLEEANTEKELMDIVVPLYKELEIENPEEYLREQVNLLWMVQKLDKEGNPIFYEFPEEI